MDLVSAATYLALVQPLVTRLIGRATCRWRLVHAVRKDVGFKFSQRQVRHWLKEIGPERFFDPVEKAGSTQANELDQVLCARDPAWSADNERHTKALAIIEATYRQMVAKAPPADRHVLSGEWARARHEELLRALLPRLDDAPALSRADRVVLLRSESEARRHVRLVSFDVNEAVLAFAFESAAASVPRTSPGDAVVIDGPPGSGKSELAEEWLRQRISGYEEGTSSAIPVWIQATDLAKEPLEAALAHHAFKTARRTNGVACVIDGLDEMDSETAHGIFRSAKETAYADGQSSFVLTCRTGVLLGIGEDADTRIHHPGLSHEISMRVVSRVSGLDRTAWRWDPSLVHAIRMPFFAVAAGKLVANAGAPRGQAELVGALVDQEIKRMGSSAHAISDQELYNVLKDLAVNATRSGNREDGLDYRQRLLARSTSLVHAQSRGRVSFSLQIIQQWFVAQALLEDPDLLNDALSTASSFDHWRWSIAVAGLSGTDRQLDELLERCFNENPGAGSWILSRIAEGHSSWRTDDALGGVDTIRRRLMLATRQWLNTLGPLSPMIFPVEQPGQPIKLGVRIDGNRVTTAWSRDAPQEDIVVELPAQVHPLGLDNGEWRPDRSGCVAEGPEWPWMLARDRAARSILGILETNPRLGSTGGIWSRERRFEVARLLLGDNSNLFQPLNRTRVIDACQRFLNMVGDPVTASIRSQTGYTVPGREVVDLLAWVEQRQDDQIGRVVPGPDFENSESTHGIKARQAGGIWRLYSDAGLQRFCAEMQALACAAYDEAVEAVFSHFGWSMSLAAMRPFGVMGDLTFGDSCLKDGKTPVLSTMVVSMPVLHEQLHHHSGSDTITAANGRAFVTLSNAPYRPSDGWIHEFAEASAQAVHGSAPWHHGGPFGHSWTVQQNYKLETTHERPCSLTAARWLWYDLKRFDLVDGGPPHLLGAKEHVLA